MGLKERKRQIAERKAGLTTRRQDKSTSEAAPVAPRTPLRNKGIGTTRSRTAPKLSDEAKRVIAEAETQEQVQAVLDKELPGGYTAISRNERAKLEAMQREIIKRKLVSVDFETDGDPDDETQDTQDHTLVGVSFSFQVGQAFYVPLQHRGYGANWDTAWFVANCLRPILEHPEVTIIAHNIKAEHGWALMVGVDMFPKTVNRKIVDTMLLIKALAPAELIYFDGSDYELQLGLKPATKELLADTNGRVHGLLHIDEIKSFKETVGKHEWDEPIPGEYYKSGPKKGLPKTRKVSRSRTFAELTVDKHTIEYACSDADWALGLYHKLMPVLEAEGLADVFFELNVPFMMVLAEYELSGWHVNPQRLEDMRDIARRALDSFEDVNGEWVAGIEEQLHYALLDLVVDHCELDDEENPIVPAGSYYMGKWRGDDVHLTIKTPKAFSWSSNPHKQWLFFHVLQMDTRGLDRSNKTGIPSTGKDNFEKMINAYEGDNAFMRLVKERAKYEKILSTYVEGMLPFVREDTNKIHTFLKLVSTWRLSSSKPNLQNIPRADNDPMGIRKVFEAPNYDLSQDYSNINPFTRPPEIMMRENLSGRTMYIACDYSQIELKVLAWYANETAMIHTLANGGDLHSKVAKDVFKLDCTVEEVKKLYKPRRYQAKKVNFGIVYGMTEYGLSKDPNMGMTKEQAKVFIEDYYAAYPGIRTYAREQIAFAREYGYVETMFGNRRAIPEINHAHQFVRQRGDNKAMNTPIQGSAGDIIRRAMVNIKKRANEAPYLRQVMQIHDELIAEVPVEYTAEGAAWLKMIMELPIDGFSDIMPIIAEPAVGLTWQQALDVSWDANGQAFVVPKHEKNEATDVTFEEIEWALPYYELANIEVRER